MYTHKQIAAAERYATFEVPILALQEVPCVIDKQVFDTRIQNNGTHRSLLATSDVAPTVRFAKWCMSAHVKGAVFEIDYLRIRDVN
jgi:hypothetical protein